MRGSKERDPISEFVQQDGKISRREFLINGGLLLSTVAALGIGGFKLKEDLERSLQIKSQLDELFPPLPPKQIDWALQTISQTEQQAFVLARKGEMTKIPQVFDSPSYREAFRIKQVATALEKSRTVARQELGETSFFYAVGMSALTAYGWWGTLSSIAYLFSRLGGQQRAAQDRDRRIKLFSVAPESHYKFYKSVLTLPPMGGKVIAFKEDRQSWIRLRPSLTAEEQTEQVKNLEQKGMLGTVYIHQLTVQGRLPDQFKYAALALIISSPYKNNWSQPFYEAPWGKIAPLVHDGGVVQTAFNPFWKRIAGRTDFLQRMVLTHGPEGIGSLDKALCEQVERQRMKLEARFYQRIALVYHASLDNVPSQLVDLDKKKVLATRWDFFIKQLETLLREFGLGEVTTVPWFLSLPRTLWTGHDPRYEADWGPVQQQLIRLEETRWKYPQLRQQVMRLMTSVTDSIDQDIGLNSANLLKQ